MRKFLALIVTPLVMLAGCGGSGTSSGPPPPPPPPPVTQVIAPPGPPNVESIVVDAGPTGLNTPAVNTAFTTVTVCMPDGKFDNCQNVDHIEVDTGSVGLRIIAGATTVDAMGNPIPGVTFNLPLPAVADPSNPSNALAECIQFADGFSWGSVNTADIKMPVSQKTATGVIVQVIGATSAGNPAKANPTCVPLPGSPVTAGLCQGIENTVPCFGANGILGVGGFINDCQSTGPCAVPNPATICNSSNVCVPANATAYFTCTSAAACTQVGNQVTPQLQLPNPAVRFANDNTGVIVELPPVGANGAAAPFKGSLVFGIKTESNNDLGSATQLTAGALTGYISATLDGATYSASYLDSGSNGDFFPTTSIPNCPGADAGFLCPQAGTTVSKSAVLQGTNSMTLAADFTIVNAESLFAGSNVAFNNLAGSNYVAPPWPNNVNPNNTLDLGLPFFYGRNVFLGFENVQTGAAPYFAY